MKACKKNLLILASAGSGKTFQLGNRLIGLVVDGEEPEQIVALTFTRKAAGEFADSVLSKLAEAAADDAKADKLRGELERPDADFHQALEKIIRVLPKLMLGTMDGFFSRVVRGFQYELGLTGGRFDLLEGQRAMAAKDELLFEILGAVMSDEAGEEFLHAFRRATIGKEGTRVVDDLREFVERWQGLYRSHSALRWGPDELAGAAFTDWEEQKSRLAATARRGLDGIEESRKGQRDALEKVIDTLESHTIGSGSLGSATGLLSGVLEQAGASGAMELKFYKPFSFHGPGADALRGMVRLAAQCEMAAACHRTRAVRDVVSVFDRLADVRLRRRGLLGFDDVKRLMGEWVQGEDARLRREVVDFRLDARYEHWLLDEFQDTSREDWLGLVPLIDEAAQGEGTVFIVGDRKQAIYGWRGGDVALFDEVERRYAGGLDVETMAESWRSCPEVLDLVNRVCGDTGTMRALFGDVASRWKWENHVSAAPLAKPEKRGESRVEVVEGKRPERLARMAEILREIGVGSRRMTCGVLVRSNSLVNEVADFLRTEGFEVIEEGRREPAKDHPVGVTLWHLLKWMANPADGFSRRLLEMSPLQAILEKRFGAETWKILDGLSLRASQIGFPGMIAELIAPLWDGMSDFAKHRAGDVMTALEAFEAAGGTTVREAVDWIGRLEVSQSPGLAAVQVMTIHKSKGLGFDVVLLPEIPNDVVPQSQHFTVATGQDWISQTPPKWVRDLLPEIREAEETWSQAQSYEAFCALYVALTRAKRGLYVLLEPPSASQKEEKTSLANLVAVSLESSGQPGAIHQKGDATWAEEIPMLDAAEESEDAGIALGPAVPRRERLSPSRQEGGKSRVPFSQAGAAFGVKAHKAFEAVGWLDEKPPSLPNDDAGRLVGKLLDDPGIRPLFEKCGRQIHLLREQPLDAVVDGKWLSGVIDRLHLHLDPDGAVNRVEVIDFKTDSVTNMTELIERHGPQMEAYRKALTMAYPAAEIECRLLSTALADSAVLE